MDFSAVRSRLAGADGRFYWRSLGELADTPEFREYLHREFPEQASEWNDPKGRRQFLKLMSASLALAGVGACTKQPPEAIVPYVRQPEDIVPGRPLFFASAIPLAGYANAVLVESHMGRPTKIEGNPDHPASLGATDAITQAAVLGLYDPDRAQTTTFRGEVTAWGSFLSAMQAALAAQKATQGAGVRFLTEPITSPSLAELMASVLQDLPKARWHQYDPMARSGAAAGTADAEPVYEFDKADVVLALDADFMCSGPGALRYTRDFSNRRRVTDTNKSMNRLYAIESSPTLTGAKADHRLPLKASEIEPFARALATAAGATPAAGAGDAGRTWTADEQKWIAAVGKDLAAHRGRSLVVAGEYQPPAVHAIARSVNEALGNVGATVRYLPAVHTRPTDQTASIVDLARAMDAGEVQLLVIMGINPVFTAPSDLKFAEKMAKVNLSVYHGLYTDETANLCHWNIPATHPLETWGDPRAYDGTVTIMQPLIAPLYEGQSEHELIAAFTSEPGRRAGALVKEYWTRAFGGQSGWTIKTSDGHAFASAESFWRRVVHDGFIAGTALADGGPATLFKPGPRPSTPAVVPPAAIADPPADTAPRPPQAAAGAAQPQVPPPAPSVSSTSTGSLEIIFRPDPTVWDGRFANNGWLQELPKPLTKLTWDTAAWISRRLAMQHDLRNGDVVELRSRGNSTKMPVMIVPGQPDNSVTVFFGYGRKMAGRVGNANPESERFNAFLLRTSDAPWFASGLEIVKTSERYLLANTQEHQVMEGRNTVRVATLAEYTEHPEVIHAMGHTPPRTLTLYPEHEYNGHKWGMTIDLTSCMGCAACVAACTAENNIPVVGKEQVWRNREMHWIRVDTYFSTGTEEDLEHLTNVQAYSQPVPCMQCELAPCEVVCPVAATAHSSEGLNDMVYNRCVGTRYCSNNCPYKVRRFNFLLYQDWTTPSLEPLRNPDVTVRSRGVMEKCTYCVQRINQARIDAKREDRAIRDGEIVTACQAVCPADAIVFGDLNDPQSRVAKLRAQQRNYGLLEDLNTRPRTTFLAALRNPNPELEAPAQRTTTGH
jgi:MoCo/4Fe-4S cofactor protein with predicted Tat translocation signal